MNLSLAFVRIFFLVLSVFLMTTFMLSVPEGSKTTHAFIGIFVGLAFGCSLIGFDLLFKRFNLRSFNLAMVGMFFGYLMGQALLLIFNAVLSMSSIAVIFQPQTLEMIKISLFLFATYLGTLMTLRSSEGLYVSIPFVKFSAEAHKKKDLLVDASVLSDARIIDLAASGLLDNSLIIPRFVMKELYAAAEVGDELAKAKARKGLETIKKLELHSHIGLRFNDTDFSEIKDLGNKLVRLARLLDAHLLTADISRTQTASFEGVRIINIHSLSNALKPMTQTGEFLRIKIQRYGKEPQQGVGYLEDGTMVVVNGGGNYLGETIDAHVLSVKHTTSGRMIFCNACDEEHLPQEYEAEEAHDTR